MIVGLPVVVDHEWLVSHGEWRKFTPPGPEAISAIADHRRRDMADDTGNGFGTIRNYHERTIFFTYGSFPKRSVF